nr:MAG TPA: hypothetical protein [Caudoviricetes sp.]
MILKNKFIPLDFREGFCICNCINLAPPSIIETEVLFYERLLQ